MNLAEFISDKDRLGSCTFTMSEVRNALGVSPAAVRNSLSRHIKKGLIASPARGFYVIVSADNRKFGCMPAPDYIPQLMKYQNRPYYAALLSAAEYHGAAHHRPQAFEVATSTQRAPILDHGMRVYFMTRKNLEQVPVQSRNTPFGTIQYSTPEATALDLVGYAKRIGGFDYAATVLAELAEKIDPHKLVIAAESAPVTWAQRLGHLLDLVDASEKAVPLKAYIRYRSYRTVSLSPYGAVAKEAPHDPNWRLTINTDVESEV